MVPSTSEAQRISTAGPIHKAQSAEEPAPRGPPEITWLVVNAGRKTDRLTLPKPPELPLHIGGFPNPLLALVEPKHRGLKQLGPALGPRPVTLSILLMPVRDRVSSFA